MTVAKRRAIDRFRRDERSAREVRRARRASCATPAATSMRPDLDGAFDDDIDDDVLRLMFVACHPVLSVRGPGRARRCACSAA